VFFRKIHAINSEIVGAASSRDSSIIIGELIAAGSRSHRNISNADLL
jgi:hypothetical protein